MCIVPDVNYTYCTDHFIIYTNIESLDINMPFIAKKWIIITF